MDYGDAGQRFLEHPTTARVRFNGQSSRYCPKPQALNRAFRDNSRRSRAHGFTSSYGSGPRGSPEVGVRGPLQMNDKLWPSHYKA